MAKEQDVVKLPFRITEFNEDMLMALDRNFKEIEDQLSALQLLIKHITGGGVKDLPNAAEIWKRAENINEDGTISATSLIGQLVEEQISDAAISASKINAGFLIVSDDLWTDNSPINGEIAWNEHDLFWNGRRYTIAAGHTANKYIYWDSMATIYGSSNTMPDLSDTGFLIAINNDGEHQIVWKQAIAKKLIGEEMLAEGAVTATKIANAAIGSAAIAEAAILAAHIHEAAIQTAHIKDAAITSAKIKDIAADKITIGSATTFEPGYNPVDNHLYFQYSVDGINWHEVFNSATDLYMRQKIGDNGTWSEPARIAAVDGVDGQDGVNGTDGISSYLWVRYSQNSNGDPMTTSPVDAKYIGIATTTTSTAPTSYASYSWSLIKGTDGVPGESGADGKTSYLHIKYSDDGVNFTGNGGEDVGVYIGTYVDFNSADSTTFSDYTWNKVKGTPIVWKGDLASPPSNPEENWVYRDIDNGYVYIYNGTVWELMVTDGADGIDGAPGVDGMSVYITYHNNPTDSQPATPTGDGTSGGWYTAPSAQANWMSQKVATNAYSGTWGAPILISGGRKFTSQPVPPYDVGDLWIGGSDGQNTLVCTTARSSGSFVASDWERMTEPVAIMGVDADCLGLWHFDGSLNSHKGVAADSDALFGGGCFGQALNIATGKHLKVPTTDMLASAGAINFRAKNLSASANGSVLVDLPKSDNSQGLQAGISSVTGHEGEIYVSDDTTTAYGPNKSTLTAWDSISLAYKSDRLSLVVNDEEACFIENPELPTAFGSHIFIGSDRNGANAINTFVDELRIDKVYHDVATRTGWHKTGVPFYTSEDMKQWPGYIRAETDGLKVYDSSNELRVLVGSWLKDAVREYGLRVISGVIETDVLIVGKKAGGVIDLLYGFGDGSDGELTSGTTLSVPENDKYVVIKQYDSIHIPVGQTLTIDKRICGMFLLCRGDVVIDGTINLTGKASKSFSGFAPPISGTILLAIPVGGDGGKGGNGGRGSAGTKYPFYYGTGGTGTDGTSGKWHGGGWGGAGGGGGGSSMVFIEFGGGKPGNGGAGGTSTESNLIGSGGAGGQIQGGAGQAGGNFGGGGGGAGNEGYGGGGGAGVNGGYYGEGDYSYPAQNGASGGGFGGGTLVIIAKGKVTINSGGKIICNGLSGGKGGYGSPQEFGSLGAGGGGGQGGGGGGSVLIAYQESFTNSGTITVNGGSGGAGGVAGKGDRDGYDGTNGGSGSAGIIGGIKSMQI